MVLFRYLQESFFSYNKLRKEEVMDRTTVIHELMWEYNLTKAKAEQVVHKYEQKGQFDELCKLITIRNSLSMAKSHV